MIERAVADKKISQDELDNIRATVWADGKISFAEIELVRTLILEKIKRGELERDW